MRNDEISRKVKSDNTILAFGEKLCTKRGHDEKQHNYIRQKLREVGRLLKDMRSCPGNVEKSLENFMYPDAFKFITQSCKNVAGFDGNTNTYATPSLALKIGTTLQKCLKILISKGIETNNQDLQTRAEDLSKLFEINWTDDVSSNALRTLHEAKQNSQKELLPLANDVKVMSEYLRHEEETHANTLQESASDCEKRQAWHKLSEICLCLIETIRRCVKNDSRRIFKKQIDK
ncbi:hypothetical protein DPMN_028112 [Dreissena polymorpha]|uniref:Uncharacterized protein n=1 Tax=Dreissena polymorpha TaxID=45954 RepID=A0A9D4G2N9_DREPO|nr:hypothetical protein DPMN_137871 [Dreissena polymorpha]KAH3865073.1 hypothetical protein DPMN_028112 [Dreissena polymorpha]